MACGAEIRYHSRSAKEVAWTYDASPVELARASDVLVRADARRRRHRPARGRRGPVLDALGIAGAGLDVFADEPHVPESLLRRDDVVLLPHLDSPN